MRNKTNLNIFSSSFLFCFVCTGDNHHVCVLGDMRKYLKRKRFNANERWMFASVAAATLARFVLIFFNWPITNSDEGNMGLVAFHIAYRGDHPTFFYGLPYLGPLEGYIAAPLFRLFGTSLFTLRLGLLPLFAAFLICMYYLTRLLYTEKFALAIVILLGLGSGDILLLQLRAVGEYPEIELFSALIPLLAAWLALTSYTLKHGEVRRRKRKRIIIYGFLGLAIGLALWVDLLILPLVAMTGLLLLLFCYRELFSWAGLCLFLGVIIGAFPLIFYNLTAPWDQNSWSTLLWIQQDGTKEMLAQHLTWVHHLVGTAMIALPRATGANPGCSATAFPAFSPLSTLSLPCSLFYGAWGAGYLVLWIIATFLAIRIIWQYRRHFFKQQDSFEERQHLICQCSQLILLGSVAFTLVSYANSPKSAVPPVITFRYLLIAFVAIPAVLWPLWNGLQSQALPVIRKITIPLLLRGSLLLLIVAIFLNGTVRTFTEIPAAQAADQQEAALVQDLIHIGATRIYSEYWTCNRLTFHSREQIICSVLDDQLNPGFDRYMPYRFIVRAASHPAYVFPLGSKQVDAFKQQMLVSNMRYRTYVFEGYIVYLRV
jgi:hypothetical protein